jgi:thiol-disulfide isomerase/thioredoxin
MWKYLLLPLVAMVALAADEHPTLAIGSEAPDFSLPGIDGKVHKLSDYAADKVMVVIFTCNHCPIAQMYESRIKKLVADYRGKSVGMVAIQGNDPNAIRIDELDSSDVSDSFEEMKIRAAYKHIDYTYLYDGDTQSVANAYGPKATPHVFVFDRDRKLRYEGRFDNSYRLELVKTQDARNAIDALLADKPVTVQHAGVFGCSTKWKYKEQSRLDALKKIEAEPVNVEPAMEADLKKLRANPTGKLLLVNFWATWCGPCVHELPDLETTYQMYRQREFEFVSVSANMPDEKNDVMKMLRKVHASTRNFLFASDDTSALQAAFDPSWQAGVPYTVLISPDGKILFAQQGELDILKLRRTILANMPGDYAGFRKYWTVN